MQKEKFLIQLPIEVTEFSEKNAKITLAECQKEHYPLFMPQLLAIKTNAEKDSRIWQESYTAPSVKVVGITSNGSKVVVYAHEPTYFCDPNNIKPTEEGFLKQAIMPQAEFQKLVELDGKIDQVGNRLVWVIDHVGLELTPMPDAVNVNKALEHPETIPFCGGESKAIAYLTKYKKYYHNQIRLHHYNYLSNDGPRTTFLKIWREMYDSIGILSEENVYGGQPLFLGIPKSREGLLKKL